MSDAHLLPPSATHAEVALSRAMSRLADVEPQCRQMWNPATCPPEHLPWLAWAFSVDEWNTAWTEAQKRGAIEASYTVHRHKGTAGAVRDALSALGYAIEMSEWFQWTPVGDPYTFGVFGELGDQGAVLSMYDDIERVALATKNVRSWLAWIRLRATRRGAFYIGGTTLAAETIEIQPYALTLLERQGAFYTGGAVSTTESILIYPKFEGPLQWRGDALGVASIFIRAQTRGLEWAHTQPAEDAASFTALFVGASTKEIQWAHTQPAEDAASFAALFVEASTVQTLFQHNQPAEDALSLSSIFVSAETATP